MPKIDKSRPTFKEELRVVMAGIILSDEEAKEYDAFFAEIEPQVAILLRHSKGSEALRQIIIQRITQNRWNVAALLKRLPIKRANPKLHPLRKVLERLWMKSEIERQSKQQEAKEANNDSFTDIIRRMEVAIKNRRFNYKWFREFMKESEGDPEGKQFVKRLLNDPRTPAVLKFIISDIKKGEPDPDTEVIEFEKSDEEESRANS